MANFGLDNLVNAGVSCLSLKIFTSECFYPF